MNDRKIIEETLVKVFNGENYSSVHSATYINLPRILLMSLIGIGVGLFLIFKLNLHMYIASIVAAVIATLFMKSVVYIGIGKNSIDVAYVDGKNKTKVYKKITIPINDIVIKKLSNGKLESILFFKHAGKRYNFSNVKGTVYSTGEIAKDELYNAFLPYYKR